MYKVNIHDAKTHLSRYLARAERGEVITICRNNVPIAELRGLVATPARPRRLGRHRGGVVIDPSFHAPLDDADLDLWQGADR